MGRVLIIDKQDSAAGLTRVLKSLGHTVAGSGEPGTEAILMVRRLLPDIVLMAADVGGRIDGVDTAGLIQEGFETPVVLLIERGDMQSVLRAEEAGICGYCMKPVKKKDLGTAIETALKRRNVEKHFKRQYGELLDNTYDLIHIQDDRGIITFVNSAVTQALGYEYDEIVGKNLKTFITPETYRFLKDRFGTEPKEGGVETYEIQVYDKRGNVRTFETRRRVVRVGDRIVEVQGISRDITERKRTERQLVLLGRLREQLLGTHCLSEKLKFITDGIIEAFGAELARIWILKPGDRCDAGCVHELVRSGPNVCYDRNRCLHLQASSGLYTHTDGAFHGRVPFDCCKIGRIASGSDQRFLTNDVTNDELLRDRAWAEELGLVSFAGYRLLSAEGEPIGVMALFSRQSLSHEEDTLLEDLAGTAAQIIQASRIEENLRKSEERYRILFENAMLGIYHALPDGRLMRVNAALARILDYDSPGEMISSVGNITQVYMESENRGKLLAAIAKKSGWGTFEECFRRKDGSPVFVRLHVSMVYGPDNVFEYSEGFVEDITEKIQVEQERKEAQEAIRRDRELKDKILQTAAVGIAFAENRKITWANTAMEDIFGFTDTSQYVGKETSILYASEKEYGRIGKLVYEGIGSGEIIETVARFRRTDTTEFLGLVRVSFVNPDDPFREIVVSISDITQRAEMEQALRESEQRYRLLAENADDIIFTMDTNLAFTYISPSVTRVRGFTVQEAMAQTLAEALTPDSMKVGIEAFRNGMKLETDRPERRVQMQVLELEETCKDGSTVWTETTFSVLRDEDGVFTGLLGITRDISQRKQAEERIRILVELLDIVPASITVHNLSGRFLYANRHTLDMHGYTQEEFFALTPGDIDVPEGGHLVVPDDRIQTEEGETSFDVEHYRKDGTKIPMIVNARIASWEGDPVVLSVAIDISERKRAETALEESEEKYRIVVENAYEGIAIIQDEVFVFANAKLLNIFGYEEKEFIGKPFTDLVIPKDHRAADSEYQRKIGGD